MESKRARVSLTALAGVLTTLVTAGPRCSDEVQEWVAMRRVVEQIADERAMQPVGVTRPSDTVEARLDSLEALHAKIRNAQRTVP